MKKGVLILVDELKLAGAEKLAVNIAIKLNASTRYTPIVCATRYGGESEETLNDNKIKYTVLQREHAYQVHKFRYLTRIIKAHNIRIVHSHKTGSSFWGGIMGTLNGVQATIAHVHGKGNDWKTSVTEKASAGLSDKIITVSEFERKRLIEMQGISASKIVTIYNGINSLNYQSEPNIEAKSNLGVDPRNSIIGISAELRIEKRHEVLLRAANEVLRDHDNVYVLIIGDGERRKLLEQLAGDLGIAGRCIFAGFRKDVARLLSIIDIGVLCSEREALPVTLLEYMASGKPIIATRVGGVPEVVHDGLNGFLVEAGDHKALAQRINLLLADREMALRMGKNGLSMVKQHFTEHTMMQQIENLYSETLASKKPAEVY